MSEHSHDLIVLGSGPSGRRAAIQSAKFGKKVLVVEDRRLGGVSVHTGTIPSKTVRESVLNLTQFRERTFNNNEIADDFNLPDQSWDREGASSPPGGTGRG